MKWAKLEAGDTEGKAWIRGMDVKWKDTKYDTAFILNAMSDDKNDPNWQLTNFILIEPEWWHGPAPASKHGCQE